LKKKRVSLSAEQVSRGHDRRGEERGHTLDSAVFAADDDGLEELVGLALLVTLLDGLDGVG
jgi:hypothetical protein